MGDHAARIRNTVNAWRQKRRISGLHVQEKNACPGFQFNADGQLLALMEQVPAALPKSFTPGSARSGLSAKRNPLMETGLWRP